MPEAWMARIKTGIGLFSGIKARLKLSSGPAYQGRLDVWLLVCFFGLLLVGLVVVTSASINLAQSSHHIAFYFSLRQAIYICGGLVLTALAMITPQKHIERCSGYVLFVALGLLFIVLLIGHEVNGSVRWLPLGVINLQPSEVAKLLLVIYMASYLNRRRDEVRNGWWGFIKPLIVLLLVIGLLLAEPDFGTAVVLVCTVMGMIFLAGAGMRQYLVLLVVTLLGIALIAISEPYRIRRLTTYMNPWAYQFGSGYQLTQALIAFGRGGWHGVGLGESIQKLFYLPEAHTDFIFSILAEELGLIGCVVVLVMLLFVAFRALRIGRMAEYQNAFFSAYLAYGIGFLMVSQVCINIGVNTGLLPTKGLALPFLSYGGSNLLVSCFSVGLLLRIDYESRQRFYQKCLENEEQHGKMRNVKTGSSASAASEKIADR